MVQKSFGTFDQLVGRVLVASLIAGLGLGVAQAQNASKDGSGDSEKLTVESSADDFPIHFTYFPADKDKLGDGRTLEDAPAVILIHGVEEDRLVWENKPTNFRGRPMTEVLANEGFAVVAVDMRGAGDSKLPDGQDVPLRDYPKMMADLEAVKGFLMKEHQERKLNINKLGVVASDEHTAIALQFAAMDWAKPDYDDAPVPSQRTPRGRDVRAIALLSVANQMGGVRSMQAVTFLKNPRIEMGVFLATGTDDPLDKGLTKRVGKQFGVDRDPDDIRLITSYQTRLRGTKLIGAEKIRTDLDLKNFLVKALKEPDVKWVDRRSRIAR